jgi:hypothetical protein
LFLHVLCFCLLYDLVLAHELCPIVCGVVWFWFQGDAPKQFKITVPRLHSYFTVLSIPGGWNLEIPNLKVVNACLPLCTIVLFDSPELFL